jgi:hypothetical protein
MTQKTRTDNDRAIAKALAHPLRQRILVYLNDQGVASPNIIAGALEERLGNVAYHMRALERLGCIELVRTQPVRGAVEHFYRATVRPFFPQAEWLELPVEIRRQLLGGTVEEIWTDVVAAAEEGGFDAEDVHVTRTPLELDDVAWQELSEKLMETLELALRLHSDTAGRRIAGEEDGLRRVELAMLLFDRPQSAPKRGRRKSA